MNMSARFGCASAICVAARANAITGAWRQRTRASERATIDSTVGWLQSHGQHARAHEANRLARAHINSIRFDIQSRRVTCNASATT